MILFTDKIKILIGTLFGLGYLPIAPGTFGALPAIPLIVAIILLTPAYIHTLLIALSLLIVSAWTVIFGSWAEKYWATEDPSVYVIDEVAGFLTTILLFRTSNLALTIFWAFLLTRIIDIIKPPPAKQLEYIHGGWGILLDDICSSLYAVGILYLMLYFKPALFGL